MDFHSPSRTGRGNVTRFHNVLSVYEPTGRTACFSDGKTGVLCGVCGVMRVALCPSIRKIVPNGFPSKSILQGMQGPFACYGGKFAYRRTEKDGTSPVGGLLFVLKGGRQLICFSSSPASASPWSAAFCSQKRALDVSLAMPSWPLR